MVSLASAAALVGCANGAQDVGATPEDAGKNVDARAPTVDSGAGVDQQGPGDDSGTPPPGDDAGSDTGPTGGGGEDSGPGPLLDSSVDSSPAVDSAPPEVDAGPPVLVGKWSFNEGTGTTSADLSTGGHAVTLAGAATWTATGKEGAALSLNGTTGYADVGAPLIGTAKSFSVFCWVMFNAVANWEVALSQDDVTGSGFGLKLRGDANQFDFDAETSDAVGPGFVVAQSKTVAVAATWVHLGGVYDIGGSGSMTVYVNGVAETTMPVGQPLPSSGGHFVIGRGLYNGVVGSYLNGDIDEVEVYVGALGAADVLALYNAQK